MSPKLSLKVFFARFDSWLDWMPLLLLMNTNIVKFSAMRLACLAWAITPANKKSHLFSIWEAGMLWTILAK
eukprot:9116171-Ditylum_brightwellii.AAC.1